MNIAFQDIRAIAHLLQTKQLSHVQLIRSLLERVEMHAAINSMISLSKTDQLMQKAKALDERRAQGEDLPLLAGIPIIYKDLYCIQGTATTCASKMLSNFIAPYTASVVDQLNQADTLCMGKGNMDEFAVGETNESSFYGPVCNPWDIRRTPGGSSGGSAAAVAAGLAPISLGSDTGGSTRQPAALCGVTGLKPTYGSISRYGMIPLASTLDTVGIFGRTADSIALIFSFLSNKDHRDATSMALPKKDYPQQKRIGVIKELIPVHDPLINQALTVFEKAGWEIKTVSMASLLEAYALYFVLCSSEFFSNMSRYGNLFFGFQTERHAKDVHDNYMMSRAESIGADAKCRMTIGSYILKENMPVYHKALKLRASFIQKIEDIFSQVGMIATPVISQTAAYLKEGNQKNKAYLLISAAVFLANITKTPALSFPIGFKNKLPYGMQLMAPTYHEERLFDAVKNYQMQTEWHYHTPNI